MIKYRDNTTRSGAARPVAGARVLGWTEPTTLIDRASAGPWADPDRWPELQPASSGWRGGRWLPCFLFCRILQEAALLEKKRGNSNNTNDLNAHTTFLGFLKNDGGCLCG